ncbi:hypothetical protein SORDD17_00146 [Streptococcus oralis]|uniref:Uncharacterized protein n=1 Tax=Streptococcus oralis TaxID=1303 RepID=A0A139RPM6_STROR|nr:hypothetical protein [Streptococcus oralis]KXU16645.1 hypothetical protein SORDD17_00146 [Streptococcus oralis]
MKFNKYLFLFLLFFLIEFRGFYLVSWPNLLGGAASNKTGLAIYSTILFLIHLVHNKGRLKLNIFGNYILILFLLLIFNSLVSIPLWGYSITQVLWDILPFTILLQYFPLYEIFQNDNNYNLFVKIGQITISIVSILFIIQVYRYHGLSTVFLKIEDIIPISYIYNLTVPLRIYSVFEGLIRIFVILVAWKIIASRFKKSFWDIISLLLMLVAIFYIDQSRYYLVTVLISILSMYFIYNKHRLTVSSLLWTIILGTAGLLVILNRFGSISNSISDNTGSLFARTGAIEYYFDKIFTYPLGLGLHIPEKGSSLYYFIKGPDGYFNYDDIGIFGTLGSLGIPGFIWYILLTIKLVMMWIKKLSSNVLVAGILISFLMSLPIMSYLDKPRIITLMLTLVIINKEYVRSNIDGELVDD